ncbi:MAG: ribonuclease HII [bacterium]|nr:ribonuclease HII [bacterium]
MNHIHLVGVDEAGRGPIAGPVAVGICFVPRKFSAKLGRKFSDYPFGKDSKKLTGALRELWFKRMTLAKKEGVLDFHVSLVGQNIIDKKGLSWAVRKAMAKALKKLPSSPERCRVLLDGALFAPRNFTNQKTIIKGDEKEFIITLASIAAKVTRDRYMTKFSQKFPDFGFEKHKGYGTRAHYEAIGKHGLCKLHRRSFLKGSKTAWNMEHAT